jgi:CubicO group peptidase (beta-lactamase class C family)
MEPLILVLCGSEERAMRPHDHEITANVIPSRSRGRLVAALAVAASVALAGTALAQQSMEAKVTELVPALDAYIQNGMKGFDLPGLAMGIVVGDKLVYAKGFGVEQKGGAPVDAATVFQIGSTTKGFLATTMAIAADRDTFTWDQRIVDLYPGFQLMDPWVTQEFRIYDIIAQRSGLPPYANDTYGMLGADETQKIDSLRYVEPTTSFRSTFTYTNITHLVAQRIVAAAMDAPDWQTVVATEIFGPLGMKDSSLTVEAIEAAPDHARGHVWSVGGTREVPFTRLMPYDFGGAGAINSSVEDLARWVRLHLDDGEFEGKRIVSAENLAVTRVPRVGMSDKVSYAMGWIIQSTQNGNITWHNGGTIAFGSFIGFALDKDVGVIVLTNETNVGLPDAIGEWTLDKLLGNPEVDHVAARLKAAKAADKAGSRMFDKPADAQPAIPLAPLVGDYANPTFGKAVLAAEDDALTVSFTAIGSKLRLDPWSGDVFTVSLVSEGKMQTIAENLGPGPLGFAQFRIDGSGKMDRFGLSFAQESKEYLFTRSEP